MSERRCEIIFVLKRKIKGVKLKPTRIPIHVDRPRGKKKKKRKFPTLEKEKKTLPISVEKFISYKSTINKVEFIQSLGVELVNGSINTCCRTNFVILKKKLQNLSKKLC